MLNRVSDGTMNDRKKRQYGSYGATLIGAPEAPLFGTFPGFHILTLLLFSLNFTSFLGQHPSNPSLLNEPSLAGCCLCQQGPIGPPGLPGDDGPPGYDGMPGDNGEGGRDGQVLIPTDKVSKSFSFLFQNISYLEKNQHYLYIINYKYGGNCSRVFTEM